MSDEEDCFGSDVGSSVDSSLCISEQDDLNHADIASVVDFDSEAPWRSWNGTLGMKRVR